MKKCISCGKNSVEDFCSAKCYQREYHRLYYKKNLAKFVEYKKKNRIEILKYHKYYYESNKIKLKEKAKIYAQSHSTKLRLKLIKKYKKCQKCGKNKKLDIHHIKYDKDANRLDNVRLLCRECHKRLHSNVKGKRNKNLKFKKCDYCHRMLFHAPWCKYII